MLSKLNWNVTAVTGFDYVDHLLERFSWGDAESRIRRHALTLVAISYTGWSLRVNVDYTSSSYSLWRCIKGVYLYEGIGKLSVLLSVMRTRRLLLAARRRVCNSYRFR